MPSTAAFAANGRGLLRPRPGHDRLGLHKTSGEPTRHTNAIGPIHLALERADPIRRFLTNARRARPAPAVVPICRSCPRPALASEFALAPPAALRNVD